MRKLIAFTSLLILLLAVVSAQNCGGSRVRSYSLDVPRATIDAQLATFNTGSSTDDSAISSFFNILNTQGSTLYYAEAPGSMGNVETVLPLNFDALGIQKPAKAYVYFAFVNDGDGGHGALIIASGNESGQTPILSLTSDGNNSTGIFTETDFAIWMNTANGEVVLRSTDVVDYDLADTIQFQMLDATNNEETNFGYINLVQPVD